MLKCGVYKHASGTVWNVIGISGNTESDEQVLALQQLNRALPRQLVYLQLTEASKKWAQKLSCMKKLTDPVIYGVPRTSAGWPVSGLYQHFKGGHYNVIGVAMLLIAPLTACDPPIIREQSDDLMVVYQSLYGPHICQLAHRPLTMFTEHVEKPEFKYSGPRFKLVEATPHPVIARATAK